MPGGDAANALDVAFAYMAFQTTPPVYMVFQPTTGNLMGYTRAIKPGEKVYASPNSRQWSSSAPVGVLKHVDPPVIADIDFSSRGLLRYSIGNMQHRGVNAVIFRNFDSFQEQRPYGVLPAGFLVTPDINTDRELDVYIFDAAGNKKKIGVWKRHQYE